MPKKVQHNTVKNAVNLHPSQTEDWIEQKLPSLIASYSRNNIHT